MGRTKLVSLVIVGALAVPGWLLAHEGHEHKVMGTVTALDANHVEVQDKDGKKVTALLNKETRYFKGKAVASATDVKVGERVVLMVVEERGQTIAKEVLLGTAGKEKKGHSEKH